MVTQIEKESSSQDKNQQLVGEEITINQDEVRKSPVKPKVPQFSLKKWFYDLPIGSKQLLIAGTSVISFIVFLITEAVIISNNYPEVDLIQLIKENLVSQASLFGVVLVLNLSLAILLARTIVKRIEELKKTAKEFEQGNKQARAKVMASDEIGQLALVFNQLAENTVESLEEIKEARERAEALVKEKTEQNQKTQSELVTLLSNVEEASSGDLTVRAEISAGEIGIVADFFNTIVESMRELVTQVKESTVQVNNALGADEEAMASLATQSLRQAKKIKRMLEFVEQMALSIQDVANSANQAAQVARESSQTAVSSGEAMDQTVKSILHLRETVGETAKKVKRLGESSQQISKVISLINQIALQTNLLAINASIEAARAGEEGRGFAVVAEEVGQLAAQSSSATKEIEQIVESIQRETSEVVQAMELGTSQVVTGTQLVEQAKQSLGQIVDVSRQIDELVQSISEATVSQTKTSEMVTNLMKDIAKVSEQMSDSSTVVTNSLQETVGLAQKLQESVGVFKVEVENQERSE